MDWSEPASALLPRCDAAVLKVLSGTTRPLTGREVARLADGGSLSAVQAVLHRLEAHGLVTVTAAGPSNLYVFNRDHVAAAAVLALRDLRSTFYDRVRHALSTWDPAPVAAAAFGSAARGEGGTDSDIDLIIVRPTGVDDDDPAWSSHVDHLSQDVRRWSGQPASIIQLTESEMADLVRRAGRLADDLRQDKIDLLESDVLAIASTAAS